MHVDVLVDDLENNPHCFHGPCLLFKRKTPPAKEYYACSACRNFKECSFYANDSDETIKIKSRSKWTAIRARSVQNILAKKPYRKYLKILKSLKAHNLSYKKLLTSKSKVNFDVKNPSKESCEKKKTKTVKQKTTLSVKNANLSYSDNSQILPSYCHSCEELFDSTESSNHVNCKTTQEITEQKLRHPTEIIIPNEDSKTQAQYFFSKQTVKNIILLMSGLRVKKILCIGAPRIHEHIVNDCKTQFQSLLLDIDVKYFNFYNEKQFIWYNMFNNCVLKENSSKILKEFLYGEKVIVLIDPPFGGRVEPLAYTLKALVKQHCEINNINDSSSNYEEKKLGIMWVFPYFMERHIQASLPEFRMCDLKIDYENHLSFTDCGTRKRKYGSAVRIFTNIPLSRLSLEGISGYKFCRFCNYWVSEENYHCEICGTCTSKDGRTYRHCFKCMKCVKPSYVHCENCRICILPDHTCNKETMLICYHCKQTGHKKRECLEEEEGETNKKKKKKRKQSSTSNLII